MIALPGTMGPFASPVLQSGRGLVRAMDLVRDEAALELGAVMTGASGKRIRSAGVPGASRTFLSRSSNGDSCNPLYRLAAIFLLMKRLGMGRERALRILGWLTEIVDQLWPEEEADLGEALEADSALDPDDDHLRFRAALGDEGAARALVEVKRRQVAQGQVVLVALRAQIGGAR